MFIQYLLSSEDFIYFLRLFCYVALTILELELAKYTRQTWTFYNLPAFATEC